MLDLLKEAKGETQIKCVAVKKEDIDYIKAVLARLEQHICFVHSTYEHLRAPLDWVCERVNYMSGRNSIKSKKTQ